MMHYYNFHINDYASRTGHLTRDEHYIYRSLIDWYYRDERAIPPDLKKVMRRLRLSADDEVALNNVLSDFFVEDENGWRHDRIERDIAKYHERARRNAENGKKGGRPRKQALTGEQKPRKTQSVISGNPQESQTKGNQEPRTKNQEPNTKKTKAKKSGDQRFADWYSRYPLKKSKAQARASWIKQALDSQADALIAKLERQKALDRQFRPGGMMPHPSTYLNQQRWEDEIEEETHEINSSNSTAGSTIDHTDTSWVRHLHEV